MKTFTKEFMANNCGCYSLDQLNACSFMNQDEITLQSIFESEIPLKDKYWFLCHKVATEEQNQELAIELAEMVLPIWEKKYPWDQRPQGAIDTAKQYLAGLSSMEEVIIKWGEAADGAADAAGHAADAGHAAALAAYAAAAADAADAGHAAFAAFSAAAGAADAFADAYAASYAANAALAVYAAADDDADAAIRKQLEDYLMTLL